MYSVVINNKVYYISYNLIYKLLTICFVIINLFYNSEVQLCDGGAITSNTDVVYQANGWGGELDGRPIPNSTGGYQTVDRDGRMIYDPYRPGIQYTTEGSRFELGDSSNYTSIQRNNVEYYPYRPGIQYTTEGSRFELDGNSAVNSSQEPNLYELDDKLVDLQYVGVDINGHPIYQYVSASNSTQVGIIEPTRSEVLNNGYYNGNGHVLPINTSKTTFQRRVYNKIKVSIKNHIAKSNDEFLRQDRARTERIMRDIQTSRRIAKAKELSRINTMNTTHIRSVKVVRRFD